MSQAVPLAAPDSPPALRLVMLCGPLLLLVGLAFTPGADRAPPHWGLLDLALLLGTWFVWAPCRLRYELTPEALVIRRLLGRDVLPCAAMRARRTAGGLGLRTFGAGLPGYLTGRFTFGPGEPRRVQAAASRARGGVLVEQGRRTLFLTPADPGAFLRSLAARGAQVDL